MPIYEYACKKCGQTIEVIQKFSDPLLKKHAGCGGALTKLISASGFQFKGTGWYVTDYARKGKPGSSDSAGGDGKTANASKDSASSGSSESSDKAAAAKPAASKPAAKKSDT
jgi:putative FmdB family regulatory protein